jgi:hypothetical protein
MSKEKKVKLKRLSFSYPADLKKELEKEAIRDHRTLPNLIKMILDSHLERKENKSNA